MRRYAIISAMLLAVPVAILPTAPSLAASAKDKMATCKFGADDQKLAGAARNTFMKKCMSNHDDPRGPGSGTPAAAAVPPPPKQ
jgi:hypothetical protein